MGVWKLNITNWTNLSIDTALFFYNESSNYLKYTIDLSEKITQRAYTLSVVIIAAIGALINFMLSFEIKSIYNEILFSLIVLSVLVLFVLGLYLVKVIFPFGLHHLGRQPKELNSDKYLTPEHLTKEQAYLSFVINEIQNNQVKIDFNLNVNTSRLKNLKRLIVLILVSFVAFVLLYSLLYFYWNTFYFRT
jgi:predicted membrane protein